jgi:hypothetical protein
MRISGAVRKRFAALPKPLAKVRLLKQEAAARQASHMSIMINRLEDAAVIKAVLLWIQQALLLGKSACFF